MTMTVHAPITRTAAPIATNPDEVIRDQFLGPWRLNTVHNVDCTAGLMALPDNCLDLVVTSPPYWGQRGNQGLGTEPDPRDYVRNLATILADALRCLKPTGVLWLNIGDSYNTPINWREDDYVHSTLGKDKTGLPPTNSAYTKNRGTRRAFVDKEVGWLQYGNLLGIPHRVIFALTDMGFLFRGEVIWEKSRAMPEGACRRPHRRHEGIYILAKSERHNFTTHPPVGSVWKLVQTPNKTPHCSTFPLDLPLKCIAASGLEQRSIICDPFMGSGTVGKASTMMGHDFIGFELSPEMTMIANREVDANGQAQLGLL